MMKKPILLITLVLFTWACKKETPQTIEMIEFMGQTNASLPRLEKGADENIYLSWVEKNGDKSTLLYSQLWEEAWSVPTVISSGNNWFVNWADFPSLVVNKQQMGAHWLQKSKEGTYDYDVKVSFSADRGQTWGTSFTAHKDGVAAEHGFVSMLPMENENTFITWLDGRNTKSEGHGTDTHGGHGEAGAMTLRAGIFNPQGNTIDEWELDDRVCDCCQTAAALTDNGPIVVYRDRSETEIRDMSIVRWVNGEWTPPTNIAIEMWEMPGCPVNGPAVIANGQNVAVTWFTAKNGFPQVKIAFSQDAGASFTDATVVSEGATIGRLGLTDLANGNVAVSWMDNQNDLALIMLAEYDQKGMLLKRVKVAESKASRSSGFPVITSLGNTVYMAWTEVNEETVVKTAKINF
ncbi:MAG: hypothetical protein COW40_07805 [Cytophagales bacterium CG17_big_fil_post_rev_8_21_14_2_50_40_13]|nr:MAG: hypothetical protein COW40_07805 [Cytophagales bacterium CG17_big_fil_post_rev_8_21_14_2_50_40_13]